MYNAADYLERSLASIVAMVGSKQSSVEVLLIDDGSKDKTVEIAENYAEVHHFFRVIKSIHQGVSATRNLGINEATGKYISFIDSDDIFKENFISIFEKLVRMTPDMVLVDLENLQEDQLMKELHPRQKISLFKLINRGRGNTGIASKFFRTDFLRKQDLNFDTAIAISEDALFNYQVIDKISSIKLSKVEFYQVLESHTLPYFNPNTLKYELEYRQKTTFVFENYFSMDQDNELLWVDNKIKLLGFIRLVDRYFGPKYAKKEITLSSAATELQQIAQKYDYTTSFESDQYDNVLGKRYIVFRKLLKRGHYKTTLVFNKYMDKIKKTRRWK